MKKVNIEDKVKQFNLCRMKYEKKAFTYQDLFKALKEFGIACNVTTLLLKHGCFDREVVNGRNLYSFQKEPLHQSILARIYQEHRDQNKKWRNRTVSTKQSIAPKPVVGEEENHLINDAIKLISNSDEYIVQKKVFDLNKFKKEQPEMYQKYLKFEIV